MIPAGSLVRRTMYVSRANEPEIDQAALVAAFSLPPAGQLRVFTHANLVYRVVMTHDPIPPGLAVPEDEAAYDRWFHATVQEAIDDPRPSIPHDQVMAEIRALIERKRRAKG